MPTAHDDIIAAFRKYDPACTVCTRGRDAGEYTHVHGPISPGAGDERCNLKHQIVVHENGTVSLRDGLEGPFGLKQRPAVHINQHPLGAGAGAPENVGQFKFAETAPAIFVRWGSYDWFAIDVVNALKARGLW
jgi:hypothetical protein